MVAVDVASAVFGRFAAPTGTGAVAVAAEVHGELTFSTSGDAGEGRSLSEDTLFDIGSIAKPLTGIVLADMALRSEVDLEAPLSTYLPELRSRPSGSVTVEQLAIHRAGLPLRPPSSDENDAISQYDGVTRASVLEDLVACAPSRPPLYQYSNFGYAVLGQLLERVTGIEWPRLLKERLFDPLGMSDTHWAYDEDLDRSRLAVPLGKRGQALVQRDVSGLVGAGGICSTARDMGRLMQACLRRPDSTIGDALTMAMEPHGVVESTDDNERFMGLGWQVLDVRYVPMRVVWKNGHGPGLHAFFGIVASRGLGLVALTNHHHTDQFDRAALGALAGAARG